MSLISRLRAVVAGDDYLDGDFDELDYETGDDFDDPNGSGRNYSSGLASLSESNPFQRRNSSSNVIGMPGISEPKVIRQEGCPWRRQETHL